MPDPQLLQHVMHVFHHVLAIVVCLRTLPSSSVEEALQQNSMQYYDALAQQTTLTLPMKLHVIKNAANANHRQQMVKRGMSIACKGWPKCLICARMHALNCLCTL